MSGQNYKKVGSKRLVDVIKFVNLQKFPIMTAEKFIFKQFDIRQDKCAMKVGTDGVILGGYVKTEFPALLALPEIPDIPDIPEIPAFPAILDVGTGTGLIALMMAQKTNNAKIVGIDVDEQAVEQAKENVANSKWADKITIEHTSLQDYEPKEKFDIVVSNPPFFVNSLKNPDIKRTLARHTYSLPMEELAKNSVRLMKEEGRLFLILPPEAYKEFQRWAVIYGLREEEVIGVRTKIGKPIKRYLVQFRTMTSPMDGAVTMAEKCIRMEDGTYSNWYRELTGEFYL